MKKGTWIIVSIISIVILSTCNGILNPNPNGHWNPLDPAYVADTDPVHRPIVTISGTLNDTVPRQTKSWSWEADSAGCLYRAVVTTEADFIFSNETFSEDTTISQESGNGTYYLFVQASDAEGNQGPVVEASAVLDNTAPSQIALLSTASRFEKVNLSWENPGEDFDHIEIRYSTGAYPVTLEDGTQIYSGSDEEYAHTGLTSGTDYYYSVFSFDAAGNYSFATTADETADILRTYAYVADNNHGLQVIECTNPSSPSITGTYDTPGYAQDVYIKGDYAYVADSDTGLVIIDISNPASPVLAKNCDTPGSGRDVYVRGNYAYIADWASGFAVVDVTDPENPVLAGSCNTPGDYTFGIYVSGDYAYAADSYSNLQVIDISDPDNPEISGSCDTSGSSYCVYISGDYAYLANYDYGLAVVDISDPDNPGISGNCDTAGSAMGVCVIDYYAYVADSTSGLQIIDVSIPESPTLKATLTTNHAAYDVFISGNYAYVADVDGGLAVVDIAAPLAPSIQGVCATPGRAYGVYVGFND